LGANGKKQWGKPGMCPAHKFINTFGNIAKPQYQAIKETIAWYWGFDCDLRHYAGPFYIQLPLQYGLCK
jgi:hypothetical protein